MARRFWPQYPAGPDPIGQHVLIGSRSTPTEIVGIVADTKEYKLTEEAGLGVYLSSAQHPPQNAVLVIRTQGDPLSFVNAVRNQILNIDRDQPVSAVASMNEVLDASEGQLRVMMALLGIFAATATIIAVVGLYGVIAYSVTQREKEIGIRKALGAHRGNILALVVGHGLRLVLSGLLLGMGGAFTLTRVLHGLLFQVSSTDPTTYIGIAFLFVAVALAATYFPAQRAAGIDPLVTLRA
jgi:ABC-type antimicrobial peptide transport system permease subunit